jgi:hypothetical protein
MKHKKESKIKGVPYSPTASAQIINNTSCNSLASYDLPQHQHKCHASSGVSNANGSKCGSSQGSLDSPADHFRASGVIMQSNQQQSFNGSATQKCPANTRQEEEVVQCLAELANQLNGESAYPSDLQEPMRAQKDVQSKGLKRPFPKE